MTKDRISAVQEVVKSAIADGAFPGAAWAFGSQSFEVSGAAGRVGYSTEDQVVSIFTPYDLASLTKPLYTTFLALHAVHHGELKLEDRVSDWVPEFIGEGKDQVTVRHLLNHSSGLPAHNEYWQGALGPGEALQRVLDEPLIAQPGTQTLYSCVGFLVLGMVLSKVEQKFFESLFEDTSQAGRFPLAEQRLTRRMGVLRSEFGTRQGLYWSGDPAIAHSAAPTEVPGSPTGVVHDENARVLGTQATNAGLFGSLVAVQSLARSYAFAERLGVYWAATLNQFLVSTDDEGARPLGWDWAMNGTSAGTKFSRRSFGHTGFTGTMMWIDPDEEFYAVLLTNRVHPTRENEKIHKIRPAFMDAVYDCLKQ